MKEFAIELIDELYICLKYALKDITLFPGDNLVEAFQYAFALTLISLSLSLLKLPTLLDWRGALVGSVILGLLILLGRRKSDAFLGNDGASDDSFGVCECREESSGTEE